MSHLEGASPPHRRRNRRPIGEGQRLQKTSWQGWYHNTGADSLEQLLSENIDTPEIDGAIDQSLTSPAELKTEARGFVLALGILHDLREVPI